MITIENISAWNGQTKTLVFPFREELHLNGEGWLLLPGLIDPHVHFRVPGGEHKEDWRSGAFAAISGGVTTVCDMPNNSPACTTLERLVEKKKKIDQQLHSVGIPLHYGLYLGAHKDTLDEIGKVKDQVVGIKIFMGCSTGDLVVDNDEVLEEVFKRAQQANLLVAVHAEDEEILHRQKAKFKGQTDPSIHSVIRSREAAIVATTKALMLAQKTGARLYILHVSTKEEIELIRQAKKQGVRVAAEVTTHHLFFTEKDYADWSTLVQMNPPIRTLEDQEALWEGIRDGTVDTLGTDHAPHTLEEKLRPYGEAPSGIPAVEFLLPLMLNAVNEGKLTLNRLVQLTAEKPQQLLGLQPFNSGVIVDLSLCKIIEKGDIRSKCGWSPYLGKMLQGWPVFTFIGDHLFRALGFNQKRVEERQQKKFHRGPTQELVQPKER